MNFVKENTVANIIFDEDGESSEVFWVLKSGFENMFLLISEDEAYNISVQYKSREELHDLHKGFF